MTVSESDEPLDMPEMPALATREDFERFHANIGALFDRFSRSWCWNLVALGIIVLTGLL